MHRKWSGLLTVILFFVLSIPAHATYIGQIGGDIQYYWGISTFSASSIWDVDLDVPSDTYTFTSTDADTDGIPGTAMTGGIYSGYSPSFNMVLSPDYGIGGYSGTATYDFYDPSGLLAFSDTTAAAYWSGRVESHGVPNMFLTGNTPFFGLNWTADAATYGIGSNPPSDGKNAVVPEPASLLLIGSGLLTLIKRHRGKS